MEFLSWHYNEGLQFFLRRWEYTLKYIRHYFSFPLLITSLFSEWKRLVDTNETGLNFSKYLEKLSFNLVSRGVGAGVRLTLFFTGVILLTFMYIAGFFGVIFWLAFPIIGYPYYLKYKKHPKRLAALLMPKLTGHPHDQIKNLFDNSAGRYVLAHVGITLNELLQHLSFEGLPAKDFYPTTYTAILEKYIDARFLSESFLQTKGILYSDFRIASHNWDEDQKAEAEIEPSGPFGKPGIGLELLFGYTPTLNKFTLDMSAPLPYSHRLVARDNIVSRLERTLTGGTSVLIVGMPGVGKKTVVLEFAYQASLGLLGSGMAYRRVLELDYSALFSQVKSLDEKKQLLATVLAEAANAGNILLVVKDIQKLTNPSLEGYDFTDIFEKYLEKRDLKVIAVTTQLEYERFIASNMRLRKFFDVIEVMQPTKQEAMQILISSAKRIENIQGLCIQIPALRAILEGSDRYISETPFPEKAIELLDAVVSYVNHKGDKIITPEHVTIVLSEKTGVSFAALSEKEKEQLSNLEDIIHEKLVNQEAAVNLIAKSLRARSAGVKEENRPVGSFLFLGPTGVGKTQTAKVLAHVYYGSESSILRFDMAEYSNREGVTRLIGSADRNQVGLLTTAIRNRPASLLLLDEIEKAPPEVYNLLLTLLDEGYITDAFGRKIDCRHLFIIATSNAGAEFIREQVASGMESGELQTTVLEHIQRTHLFSPEFLNRFDGVVVYEPLTQEHLLKVAKLQLTELAVNLRKKNIFLKVTDQAADKVAQDGYDPAFGARSMRRIIDLSVGDVIGKAIISNIVTSGDHIELIPGAAKGEYRVEKLQSNPTVQEH